ncbi:MAG: hypothetical protein U9R38_04095 [Candidatus Margulisiibacteriota bacterium]|nr:hypothetical protein [Candidatus Margulisiibacteriota bacterium]
MTFNICPPANSYVRRKILPFYAQKRARIRRPLIERAREARDKLAINYSQAVDYWWREEFQLGGGNIFSIKNEAKNADGKQISLVISHFGSIFQDSDVQIRCRESGARDYTAVIDATPFGGDKIFHIRFVVVRNNLIDLASIRSEAKGYGGKGLTALYNFAKDIGCREIIYTPKDDSARRFYLHMDFISAASQDLFRLRIS